MHMRNPINEKVVKTLFGYGVNGISCSVSLLDEVHRNSSEDLVNK